MCKFLENEYIHLSPTTLNYFASALHKSGYPHMLHERGKLIGVDCKRPYHAYPYALSILIIMHVQG